MYILRSDKLLKGDIILMRSSNRISEFIRIATNSNFSHAMLYVGTDVTIESDGPGVYSNNIKRRIFENESDVTVLRLKDTSTCDIEKVIQYARSKIGTEYSIEEAKGILKMKNEVAVEPNRQFCTRLVANSYSSANCNIVEHPDYCSPEEIEKSILLNVVENALKVATDEEVKSSKTPSVIDIETESMRFFLDSIRKITGEDIQNFQQVVDYMMVANLHEVAITNALEESGYLTLSEHDRKRNPWHYDYDKFLEHYPEKSRESSANQLLKINHERKEMLTPVFFQYFMVAHHRKIKFFSLFVDLYNKELKMCDERIEVGLKYLRTKNSNL